MKNIFNGNVKKNDQHNPADGMKDEKGEKKPLKTYKDLFKTAPRKEPKGQGFKEEVDKVYPDVEKLLDKVEKDMDSFKDILTFAKGV